jgi:hypothetical protein
VVRLFETNYSVGVENVRNLSNSCDGAGELFNRIGFNLDNNILCPFQFVGISHTLDRLYLSDNASLSTPVALKEYEANWHHNLNASSSYISPNVQVTHDPTIVEEDSSGLLI